MFLGETVFSKFKFLKNILASNLCHLYIGHLFSSVSLFYSLASTKKDGCDQNTCVSV